MKVKQMELPPGWEWTTMGEIADVVGGGTPKTNEPSNYEGGTIPWLTPADLSGYTAKSIGHGARYITQKGLDTSSAKMMPAGTVLFTSRAPIGYVVIASNPVCTNQGFKSFVLKDGVLPDYMYWWLKGSKDLAEGMASGTTFLELSGAKAKQLPIPIAPLDQQKCIVAEIEKQFSRLDEAVANLKRVKANLKRYKAAVLKAAVEGRLVETEAELARREGRSFETGEQLLQRILETRRSQWKGKGKYKEPAAPDTSDLPELPEGWVWASLDQLSDVVRGGSPRPAGDPRYFGGPVPWITVGLLTGDESDYLHRVPEGLTLEGKERSRYIEPDTLLLTNSGATLGVPKISLIGGCINDGVAALLGVEYPLKRYLVNFLRTKTMSMRRINQGAAQPNLNTSIIKAMVVPLPPEAEQHRIVAEVDRRLSLLSETEAQVDANLQRAEHLRQAVLASAFRGQLESQGHNHGNRSKTTE
jgi:type I restriction enzyme S subunit